MIYSIAAETMQGQCIETAEAEGVKAALKAAHTMAARHPGLQVYVSWYRESDGQGGFLNPGGDHDITGKPHEVS